MFIYHNAQYSLTFKRGKSVTPGPRRVCIRTRTEYHSVRSLWVSGVQCSGTARWCVSGSCYKLRVSGGLQCAALHTHCTTCRPPLSHISGHTCVLIPRHAILYFDFISCFYCFFCITPFTRRPASHRLRAPFSPTQRVIKRSVPEPDPLYVNAFVRSTARRVTLCHTVSQ